MAHIIIFYACSELLYLYIVEMNSVWRACNLTSFSPCLTGPVDYPFASRHKGPGFKPQGDTYVKPGFSC